MFESGAGKLLGGCRHWWDGRGLQLHLESQPFPSRLAWHLRARAPEGLLRLACGVALALEALLPALFLQPFRRWGVSAARFRTLLGGRGGVSRRWLNLCCPSERATSERATKRKPGLPHRLPSLPARLTGRP